MDIFCPKHIHCEDPIKVIAEILEDSPEKISEIEKEFISHGLFKVKDLASATLSTVCNMNVKGDPLGTIYKAIAIYDARYAEEFAVSINEFDKGNFVKTIEVCNKLILSQPNDIQVINLLAVSYFNCENYDTSIEYLEAALKIKPNCFELLINLGSAKWKKYQYEEASEHYTDALIYRPNDLKSCICLAGAYSQMDGTKQLANQIYTIILNNFPELYSVRNKKGLILISLNQIDEAKQQFEIVKEYAPEYPDAWANLGKLYAVTGEFENAILHYKKALELNPNTKQTWVDLGVAYNKLKDYQNSIQSFRKALKLCPNDIQALSNLAFAYENFPDLVIITVECYKKCLKLQPDHKNNYAWNLKIGLLYIMKQQKYLESEPYLKKCIEQRPREKLSYKYLGIAYREQKKFKCASENFIKLGDLYYDEHDYLSAYELYTNALVLDPENADGHWKLGRVMFKMNYDADLALERLKMAVDLEPNLPNPYYDIALIYEAKHLLEKACKYYKTVLTHQPDHLNSLYNLSNLEFKLGNYNNAVEFYKRILEVDNSKSFEIHMKLADVLYKKMESFDEAIYYYKKALELDDNCFDAYLNLGNIFREMDRSEDALHFFGMALKCHPQCVIAHTNIGSIYKDNANFTGAIQAYKDALSIEPDIPDAYCNLVQCLQHVCDWSDYDLRIEKLKDIVHKQLDNNQVPSLLPHYSLLYPFTPEVLKNIALKYADQCAKRSLMENKSSEIYSYQTSLSSHEPIRVGYVSSDFGHHPTSQRMKSIPNHHNRNRFKVFCYSLSPNDSSPSWSKISSESDIDIRDISNLNVIDAANLIHEDKIHILVNMSCAQNEINALRPAPIQVLWPGYPGTSGATFIDYLITDQICSPPNSEHFYTEKLAYLKQSVFIGDHKQVFSGLQLRVPKSVTNNDNMNTSIGMSSPLNNGTGSNNSITHNMYSMNTFDGPDSVQCYTRESYNIPEDAVVYCNFSQLCKIDPSTFNMWATILHNVPNSVLWLLRFPADGEVNLQKYADSLAIDMSRIIFSDFETKNKHIARIQLADVFLDTPLCNARTACLDALWAGTPVVTLPRDTFASRVAASQLTTLGDKTTIANDEKHYIEIATRLGTDKNFLDSHRQNIWSLKNSSKLFNCQLYTDELESVYEDMWKKFLSKDNNMEIDECSEF